MPERSLVIGFMPTQAGNDAVRLGRAMAEVTAAVPVVASVLPWPRHLMGADDLERALEAGTKRDFAAVAEELVGLGPEFRAVAHPSAAEALQDIAQATRAEMIVIGSAHRGPVGRTLLGTTGHSLLYGAPCPVAVAPKGYAEADAAMRVVGIAFDGSAPSWAALETGIGIAERLHAVLEVVVVTEPPRYGYTEAFGVISGEGLRVAEQSEKTRLIKLAEDRVPPDLEVRSRRPTGNAGRMLAEASRELDLLICGSRGYGPLLQTALGSTTRALIDHAECPVLVLPRGKGLDPLRLGTGPRATVSAA